jgi:hypothetical protein
LKYECPMKEPPTGIFPLKRNTSTNYSFQQFQTRDLPLDLAL